MKFIQSLFALIFAVIIAVFSVSNMDGVSVVYSPVHDAIELPLYTVALGGALIGFICGAFLMWLSYLPKSWAKRKEIKGLKKDLKTAEKATEKEAAANAILIENTKHDA